jgi:ribosomal protein S18 acetylase RimI-like enzyme
MSASEHVTTRVAQPADAQVIGRLLHEFNLEYGDLTPGPAKLAERMGALLAEAQTCVLLGGGGPDGLAVLRFRPAIWTEGLECYLAELYVAPEQRGRGVGRALLAAAIELARSCGATYMDLCSAEDDVAARALYERFGFSNREGKPDGPLNYYYEREL